MFFGAKEPEHSKRLHEDIPVLETGHLSILIIAVVINMFRLVLAAAI